jgi:Tfp pilus assembly protein PilO
MASPIDSLVRMPLWQRAAVWVVFALLIGVAWYMGWYADAVAARETADAGLKTAEAELDRMRKKLENYEEERRQAAEAERQIQEYLHSLPMSASTIDNLMQTFQQEARVVGLTVETWTPGTEQRLDFYAKLPVKIRATASWHQTGEFFRRLSELRQIVSVENLQLRARAGADIDGHPGLDVTFDAATYRFLTAEERGVAPGPGGAGPQPSSRRQAGADKKEGT